MLNAKVDQIECTVAIVLSIVVLLLGLVNCIAGEGIWQDEAGTVAMANMPVSEFWSFLPFLSFPPLFLFFLKALFWIGIPQSPLSLRIIGYGIGVATLGVLWWRLRRQGGLPLASLVLFASVPDMIRYGQSIRAYGLGVLSGIVLISCAWEYVQKPSWRTYLFSAFFGLLVVHCLYQSWFLLASVCLGAGAVLSFRQSSWKQIAGVIAVGIPAALTLPIYIGTISTGAASFRVLADQVIGPKEMILGFLDAVSTNTRIAAIWWLLVLAVSLLAAVRLLGQSTETGFSASTATHRCSRERAVFSLVIGVSFTLATVFFLWLTSAAIKPWHLILWVSVIGALTDDVLAVARRRLTGRSRLAILSIVILAVVGNAYTGWSVLDRKYTAIDVIARRLKSQASGNDLILVYPWAAGVSFNYYYHGQTPWETIPPLGDHRIHRSDLVRAAIEQDEVMEPIEQLVQRTLSNGDAVWLIGTLPAVGDIAPIRPTGYFHDPWLRYGSARLIASMLAVGATIEAVPVQLDRSAKGMEDLPLSIARKVVQEPNSSVPDSTN